MLQWASGQSGQAFGAARAISSWIFCNALVEPLQSFLNRLCELVALPEQARHNRTQPQYPDSSRAVVHGWW